MKVRGFLKDAGGAARVIKARRRLIAEGSRENHYSDPIREIADELHPSVTRIRIVKTEEVSCTAKMFTFEACEGYRLPPFEAGQYCSLDLKIGNTVTTRPYSICSAPYQARKKDHPFFALTIRNGRPSEGFASSWLYEHAEPGDEFDAHLPFGQFYYEPLRDAKHLIALAGGSGITPFFSMAQEIAHGTMDADLTILYGSRNTEDIILERQLAAVSKQCSRVRFINVISDEPEYQGEKGFLSADLIRKYSGREDCTYFVCGPLPMYQFVSAELHKLRIPERRIRFEVFGAPRDITKAEGYHGDPEKVWKCTVCRGIEEQTIDAKASEPLAVALERAGIPNHTRCRSGACGYCRCQLLEGEVFIPSQGDGRRYADRKFGYVHACSSWPLSDVKIRIIIQ